MSEVVSEVGVGRLNVARLITGHDIELWRVSAARVGSAEIGWLDTVAQVFLTHPEVASVSIVERSEAAAITGKLRAGARLLHAATVALPICYFGGNVADLLGIDVTHDQQSVSADRFRTWADTATRKGLAHVWLVVDSDSLSAKTEAIKAFRDPGGSGLVHADSWLAPLEPPPINVGIDAAWLLGAESGAQVFAFEMLKELARRPRIGRLVMLSEQGSVPAALANVPKIASASWNDVAAPGFSRLDIIHRPYQPGLDVDYQRYYAAGDCVAVTVLDFIAYDNPWYHETERSWQQYRAAFDENVCLADYVFAISAHVGSRTERQYGHGLSGPVRSVLLGTDHLSAAREETSPPPPSFASLESAPFLLVLGNDFAHKNRDFAVKVFADMRDRGYGGRLVLAGFHLDLGSSYSTELDGAGAHADSIVRTGAVSSVEKTWLMQHADAVLYPTSSEGFGLVPFEAAALGTPTAFVRFGALRETMPEVAACEGWRVRLFADHTFALIADRQRHVAQVRAAAAALTWSAHVDAVLEGYEALMTPGAPWRSRSRTVPGRTRKIQQAVTSLKDRVTGKVSRVFGVPQR